jgi:NADPH:quinone reductase-like Zn-dependent oxidoreductase
MTSAKARAVRFDRYGGRDVLYVADIDMPPPAEGEVLVEVRAAGINPGEAAVRVGAIHEMFPASFRPVRAATSLYVAGATAYAAVRAVAPRAGETVAVSAAHRLRQGRTSRRR